MNQLITIVGASGVGKTTLVRALGNTGKFALALEQHTEQPFQALFKQDKNYALANQIDYFLLRAEQEQDLRSASQIGLMDGGLDLDFHGFTRLFHHRGLLNDPEFDLCLRLYTFMRTTLPQPDLIVRLVADSETVASRLSTRDRINIARVEDTTRFNSFVDEWLTSIPSDQLLTLDVSNESMDYRQTTEIILNRIENIPNAIE
jgi:deoxyadenosine/deoxycytidine kinase